MKTVVAILAAASVSGCAGWSTETKIEEGVYQTLSVVDTVQSAHAARTPGYEEVGHPTSLFIGSHPTQGQAIGWGVARSAVHAAITDQLERHNAPVTLKRIWQGAGIAYEGKTVHFNYTQGLRLDGSIH
jgi:hypothetical protein